MPNMQPQIRCACACVKLIVAYIPENWVGFLSLKGSAWIYDLAGHLLFTRHMSSQP